MPMPPQWRTAPPRERAMNPTPWEQYVRRLARDAWSLDATGTEALVKRIGELVATEAVTDAGVADILYDAGVQETSADLIAPSIRVAITA